MNDFRICPINRPAGNEQNQNRIADAIEFLYMLAEKGWIDDPEIIRIARNHAGRLRAVKIALSRAKP